MAELGHRVRNSLTLVQAMVSQTLRGEVSYWIPVVVDSHLDIREALKRLGDASGSQLDERLVKAFIDGLETAEDAPLPGQSGGPTVLWTPRAEVA